MAAVCSLVLPFSPQFCYLWFQVYTVNGSLKVLTFVLTITYVSMLIYHAYHILLNIYSTYSRLDFTIAVHVQEKASFTFPQGLLQFILCG